MSDVTLRIALVQEAGDLDPDVNRSRLADLVPDDADLVVLPEAFARDFGSPGDDVSAFAEEVGGPFDTELTRVAEQRGTTVVAGSFERSDDPGRPFNTLLVRGRSRASYRKIHLYDSFGYRESDRLSPGRLGLATAAARHTAKSFHWAHIGALDTGLSPLVLEEGDHGQDLPPAEHLALLGHDVAVSLDQVVTGLAKCLDQVVDIGEVLTGGLGAFLGPGHRQGAGSRQVGAATRFTHLVALGAAGFEDPFTGDSKVLGSDV